VKFDKSLLRRAKNSLVGPLVNRMTLGAFHNTASQIQLQLTYSQLVESGGKLPPLSDVGFSVFSQDDQDGLLLYIFAIIGTTNKKSVELCAGDGISCSTANLIINHGWLGLMIDGDAEQVARGRQYYRRSDFFLPSLIQAWVTRGNVNSILTKHGFEGEIDLLVIDMDGVDYWIWEAIDVIAPRVVFAEYQGIIGPEYSITVPYSDDFDASKHSMTEGFPNYCGASLTALTKLAKKKGYRLVGRSRRGIDAIFVRSDLGVEHLPETTPEECLKHPTSIWGIRERFPLVKDLPWVEV